MIADDDAEPDFDHADLAALMAYAKNLTATDEAKWLFVDSCIRYEEYRARLDRVLDQVEPLIREKADLLEPYVKEALGKFEDDASGGKLFSHLSESGLRLDCTKADVYPYLMQFSSIMLYRTFSPRRTSAKRGKHSFPTACWWTASTTPANPAGAWNPC
jgi:hypothetical protein